MADHLARIAVEYGHRHFWHDPSGGLEGMDYVGISALLADDLRSALCRQGNEVALQILLDDKKLSDDGVRRSVVAELVDDVAGVADPESVISESRLRHHFEGLISGLRQDKQQSRRRKLISYLERHGHLACSQDIAIWHALRLGAIEVARGHPRADEVQVRSSRLAVSILSERHRQFEEVADRDYLRWHSVIDPTADVLRFYVPDDTSMSDTSTTSSWRDFRDLVLRRARVVQSHGTGLEEAQEP